MRWVALEELGVVGPLAAAVATGFVVPIAGQCTPFFDDVDLAGKIMHGWLYWCRRVA